MYRNILFLIALAFISCNTEKNQDIAILENAPYAGTPIYENTANFELSLGNYKDSATIKYCVVNNPPKMTWDQGVEIVAEAIDQWANAVNKPFIRVDSASDANIVVSFEFMDGTGGQLDQTSFPPNTKIKNWNRSMIIDAYDVNADSKLDPVKIVTHSFGHALGLNDSQDKSSQMYAFYYDAQKMGIDDQIGARIAYDNKKKFEFNQHEYIPIINTDIQITENFKMLEFFSDCTNFRYDFFFLDAALVTAIQTVRYTYDQPIEILSTYRPIACNASVGGVVYSRHMKAQALDFKFVGTGWQKATNLFVEEIKAKGCLFQTMISTGIGGFGAYDHSFHIDTRKTGLHKWFNIEYATWGKFSEGGYFLDLEHPDDIYGK